MPTEEGLYLHHNRAQGWEHCMELAGWRSSNYKAGTSKVKLRVNYTETHPTHPTHPLSFFTPYAKQPALWARGNSSTPCLPTYARSSGHWHKRKSNKDSEKFLNLKWFLFITDYPLTLLPSVVSHSVWLVSHSIYLQSDPPSPKQTKPDVALKCYFVSLQQPFVLPCLFSSSL